MSLALIINIFAAMIDAGIHTPEMGEAIAAIFQPFIFPHNLTHIIGTMLVLG